MLKSSIFSLIVLFLSLTGLVTIPSVCAQEGSGSGSGGAGSKNEEIPPDDTDDDEEEGDCGEEESGKSRMSAQSSFATVSGGFAPLSPEQAKPVIVGLRAVNDPSVAVGITGEVIDVEAKTRSAAAVKSPAINFTGGISSFYATPESLVVYGTGAEVLRAKEGWVRQLRSETGFMNVEKIENGYKIVSYTSTEIPTTKNAEGFYPIPATAAPLAIRTVVNQGKEGKKILIEEESFYGVHPKKESILMEQFGGATRQSCRLRQTYSNHNGVYKTTETAIEQQRSENLSHELIQQEKERENAKNQQLPVFGVHASIGVNPDASSTSSRTERQGASKARSATLASDPSVDDSQPGIVLPPIEDYMNTVHQVGTDGKLYVVKRERGQRVLFRSDKGPVRLWEDSALDSAGAPLPENIRTVWKYYLIPQERDSYGRPRQMTRSDGYWEEYIYANNAAAGIKTSYVLSPWLNTPAAGTGAENRVYRVREKVDILGDTGTSGIREWVDRALLRKEWTDSVRSGRDIVKETRHQAHAGGDKITITTRYCREKSLVNQYLMGKPLLIEHADGSLETFQYTLKGNVLSTTHDKGYGTSGSGGNSGKTVTKGIRTVTQEAADTGKLRSEICYALEGGQAHWLSSRTGVEFDPLGNCLKWVYNNDTNDYSEQRRDCCRINWERGRDGVETSYLYNAQGEVISETTKGITYITERNGLTITRKKKAAGQTGQGGELLFVREEKRDMAGNLIRESTPATAESQLVTTYEYNIANRSKKSIDAWGKETIEVNYADKQLASFTGKTGLTTQYTYTPTQENGGGFIVEAKRNNVTQTQVYDLLDNLIQNTAGNGGLTHYMYNAGAQLIQMRTPDGELVLYNNENGVEIQGIDMDKDGVLSPTVDIINKTITQYTMAWPENKGSWQTTTEAAYHGNWITQNTTWQTEDGTQIRQQKLGETGYTTQTMPAPKDKGQTYIVSQTTPTGQEMSIEYLLENNGIVTGTITQLKDNAGTLIATKTSTQDIWGQTLTDIDSRTGTSTYTYDETTGAILSVKTPNNKTITYQYDWRGRKEKTLLTGGEAQYIAYDDYSNIIREWGSQKYPVEYEYDAYGRKIFMTTYKSSITSITDVSKFPHGVGITTRWMYDSVSGRLVEKRQAGEVAWLYTHTLGGKMKTMSNARGNITTFTYDDAGQKIAVTVNDNGITPAQSYAYDQWARLTQATTEGVAQYGYQYNALGQLVQEDISLPLVAMGGGAGTNALTRQILRSYDENNRPIGYQLKHGNTVEQAITYSYNAVGQIGEITADGKEFSYGYVPQAPQLMGTMDSPVHSVTNVYYEDRDVLQIKLNIWKNKPDNAMISRYIYGVNSLGQRTSVRTAGTAFDVAHPADWLWSYDPLGQVKSANQDIAENYQYAYDQIGNRITTRKGTAPELTYTSNSLNQYTAIGNSLTPSYDADGNQLSGLMPTVALPERGQLTFGYNAHNRLIAVSKNNIILENYTHDHEGRRIQEGSTITIYDGYNAIAEYSINGVLKTSYAWGLDLSNTLQGAGGVGGLLSVTDYTTQTPLVSYPTYDGNGNVTEYVTEANNGTISAHYEYDAFGNVTKKIGTKEYSYQFSTKPYNKLTGLSYYNYRDYDSITGRWTSPDPIEEQGGLNLYGFLGNDSISLVDVLGWNFSSSVDEATCTISITLDIVIYPSEGDQKAKDNLSDTARQIKASIEGRWNGKKKGCCNVNVSASVTTQNRASTSLYRWFYDDENNIEITSEEAHRSYVMTEFNRTGTIIKAVDGKWRGGENPWVYAHEAGHLMLLNDDYKDTPSGGSKANAGHEGHMMATHGGDVAQHEIDDMVSGIECPCDP